MAIYDIIARACTEPAYHPPDLKVFREYVCRVLKPASWNRQAIECVLGFSIPESLAAFWQECGGMVLYEEATFQQGGLVILPPDEALTQTLIYQSERDSDARTGDFIFGRFLGDLRLALIRCDKTVGDYAAIMIVAEMDERANWYTAAQSLEDFLVRYMDAHGDDYWDVNYERILAARAKRQGK